MRDVQDFQSVWFFLYVWWIKSLGGISRFTPYHLNEYFGFWNWVTYPKRILNPKLIKEDIVTFGHKEDCVFLLKLIFVVFMFAKSQAPFFVVQV
jgi:hypothetical protein